MKLINNNLSKQNKKSSKLVILMTIITVIPLIITGCWDRNEPENRAFVLATGFDYDEDQDLYEITVQVADPTGIEGGNGLGGGGGNDGPNVGVMSAKGRTPYHAAKNLQLHMTREPFFTHNKLLIISEDLARRGIGPVLDYFDRERETRLIAFPAILPEEHDITQLFRTELPFETYIGEGIERQIILSVFERSVFPSRSLIESFNVLSMPGRETVIGKIDLGDQEEEDILGEEDVVRGTTRLEGGAVFKGDQMQGWFDIEETRGWFWIHGNVDNAIKVINCPVHDTHPISIEIFESESHVNPIITEEGDYQIDIKISADGRIQDQTCPQGYEEEGELIDSIENRTATAIKNEIKSSIERAHQHESDVFGFGNVFYRKKPDVWDGIKHEWQEEIFTDLAVNVDVEFELRRAGLVTDPLIRD
ncbi:Ger(x)C family spore germination protein [Natranaerobius thermophilus]|uniref:Germination protein, Ger(X)C family n=1 Tax=Natranaerobius thermophilus (strain ATCC BAA-1301 / DSM 18059 / JW/NM-WN-LF) TaxID=457570 RepID=B2A6R4_NATTJ|nr:Ger(x)C family spore germination protein [Natranaerobius thermophilus]ACB84197.1 germination protein, Ger(x)C family [Natranaerobius thermophilus JW/NM-WN-LF]